MLRRWWKLVDCSWWKLVDSGWWKLVDYGWWIVVDYGGQSQTVLHSFRQLPSRDYRIVYNSERHHPSSLFLSLALDPRL